MVTSPPLAVSSPSSAACFFAWFSRWDNSSSVSSARSPRLAGRCMGMLAVAGHCPCRSGSPQGVLAGVQLLFDDAALAAGAAGLAATVCAAAGKVANAAPKRDAKTRYFMRELLSLTAPGLPLAITFDPAEDPGSIRRQTTSCRP